MATCQARMLTSSCAFLAICSRDSWPSSACRTIHTWGLLSYDFMVYYIHTFDYTGVVFILFARLGTAFIVHSSCIGSRTRRA